MAGFYPDVPAPRIPYDRDGTVFVFVSDGGTVSGTTLANAQSINDENDGTEYAANFGTGWYAFIFPQLRDLYGYFLRGRSIGGTTIVQVSTDTTNGMDGTWSTVGTSHPDGSIDGNTIPQYRTDISSLASMSVKAFRVRRPNNQNRAIKTIHIYGVISAGESPDRVRMWHPTLDEPLDDGNASDGAFFDWGDIERNQSSDKTFRIKNNSATQTANGIVISQQTLTDTSPTVNSQFAFSDGGAFAASIDIGNLAPGAISPVITKRYNRPSNATLSLWTSRTIANPTSWS